MIEKLPITVKFNEGTPTEKTYVFPSKEEYAKFMFDRGLFSTYDVQDYLHVSLRKAEQTVGVRKAG